LQNANTNLAQPIAWISTHVDWLTTLNHLAYAAAALALASNVVRGIRFMQPMLRGVSLLDADVVAKRRDLDGLYAHQMRRVDGLAAEVERTAQQAALAERRAGNHGGRTDAHLEPSPFDTGSLKMRAERFFASLGRALHRPDRGPVAMTDIHKTAPERVIIALDNLDALAPDAAWSALDAAHRALAQPGFVLLLALDSTRLSDAQGEIRQRLEKWIQVPFRVGPKAAESHAAGLVAQIIGRSGRAAGERKVEAAGREAGVDWAISDAEAALLGELAPIAGPSPRTVKRFVNLYRVVRSQAPEIRTALALRLALDLGGTDEERAAAVSVLAEPAAEAELFPARFGPRIAKALRDSGRFEVEAFRKADEIVRRYSLHG
jgi:KAP family P-loop domain